MKIGIMLRHFDQHGGGVHLYTRYLLKEMLELETEHEFILIYKNPDFIGTYSNLGKNIKEISVSAKTTLTWDQIAIPKIAKKEKIDLIFNPKYSIPLFTKSKKVFVSHGLDWYVMPWGSKWSDRLSHKYLIPRYANKSDKIIAVSNTTKKHLVEFLNCSENKVKTIYLGISETYRNKFSNDELAEVKKKFNLPERFFLFAGQIYPPKNFGRLLKAFAKVGPQKGISLVAAGEHRWLCDDELDLIDKLGISKWVIRPGWINHDELAKFYNLADALLMPSLYEACPSPILEAMASGCPLVTSNRYGTAELASDAAVLVDPENVESIANGMEKIITNDKLRNELIIKGYERSGEFNWKKCAMETLETLDNILKN